MQEFLPQLPETRWWRMGAGRTAGDRHCVQLARRSQWHRHAMHIFMPVAQRQRKALLLYLREPLLDMLRQVRPVPTVMPL